MQLAILAPSVQHVLHSRSPHTYEDLGCRIVNIQRLQNRGPIIGHCDALPSTQALQDLVLFAAHDSATQLSILRRAWQDTMSQLTIPLGPRVLFTTSAIAIAPTKDACSTASVRPSAAVRARSHLWNTAKRSRHVAIPDGHSPPFPLLPLGPAGPVEAPVTQRLQ